MLNYAAPIRHLSTTRIFCGTGSQESTRNLAAQMELTGSQVQTLQRIAGPSTAKGAELMIDLATKEAQQITLNAFLHISPTFMWAITTNAQDQALRGEMYTRVGNQVLARKMLVHRFPGATAVEEINAMAGAEGDNVDNAIQQLAQQIITQYQRTVMDSAA